ncbi:hypothetical protein V6259_17680 [Marinomonas sp. TI.3.20]|uniref:hypothetical protein n=1 Tax=Marinomonas sp. TI.3.20 TaxID=3121296 RepID=UPI00312041C5
MTNPWRSVKRWYQSLSGDIGIKLTSQDIRKLARDSWQDMGIDWVIGEMLLVSVRASPSRQAQILIYYFFPFLSGVKRQVGLRL